MVVLAGRYEVLSEVGRGARGVVHLCRDRQLDRTVAVKGLIDTSGADFERFEREARVAARLHHPHIVPVFDFARDGAQAYLAMDYIAGHSLDRRIEAGDLPRRDLVEVLRQIAEALHYAHQMGVVHRDVKPENIIVDAGGRGHLTDFGLARRIEGEERLTLTGAILGTPAYLSPEQASGGAAGPLSDVYNLGATMYFALTRRLPHEGTTLVQLVTSVLSNDPAMPRSIDSGISPDLETICLKAMDRDPARRYASAGAMAEDLRRCRDGEPIVARQVSMIGRVARRMRRHPALWTLASALVTTLVGGAAFGLWQLTRVADAAEARADLEAAQRRVDEARALLADVKASLYIEGCSLAPSYDRLARARVLCDEALSYVPDHAEARYWKAKADLIEEKYDSAIRELEIAASSPEAGGHIWAELGRAHMDRGLRRDNALVTTPEQENERFRRGAKQALECFKRAGAFGEGIDAAVARAYELLAERDHAALERWVAECRERFGAAPGVEELEVAMSQTLAGREAIERLDRAIGIRPGHFGAVMMRGAHRAMMGDRDGALADFERAIQINPNFAEAVFNRGSLHQQAWRLDDAIADYDRALEINPGLAQVYKNRGIARSFKGDATGGIADLGRAIELDPTDADARVARSLLRAAAGELEAAEADMEAAVAADDRRGLTYAHRGALRAQRGDLPGAFDDFEKALALDPRCALAYLNRGLIHQARGDREEAVADFGRALAIDPRERDAWLARARLRAAEGDWERAVDDYGAVLTRWPADAETYVQRGNARQMLRDFAGAREDYDRSLELRPDAPEALANRGSVRAMLGEPEEGAADIRRALKLAAPDWPGRASVERWLKEIEGASDF